MKPKIALGCVLAILVAVVALIVLIEIVEFCQRHFAPPPDPQPNATNVAVQALFVLGATPITPAALQPQAKALPECETTVQVSMKLVGTNLVLFASLPNTVDPAAFFAALPTTNSDAITYGDGTVTVGTDCTVIVESSHDTATWTPVITNRFNADQTVNLTLTAPCTNFFYRGLLVAPAAR